MRREPLTGNTGGDSGPCEPVNETATDSRTGEEEAGNGAVLAAPCHRLGMDEGGLPADPQGRRSRHRRRRRRQDYEANLEANLVGPPRTHQIRPLPSAAGPQDLHPQGGRLATAARHPDLRRQGGATRDRDGAGGCLRAGLPALLVWLPARPLGASGAATTIAASSRCSGCTGCWTSTYASISIRSRTPTFGHSSTSESRTASSGE